MKCASEPSAYRNCILRASVRTLRNFSPARNVRSITAPSEARRSFVRTNAPPLPGLTCWNSRILKIVPSTSMWLPALNWLVETMRRQSMPMDNAMVMATMRSGLAVIGDHQFLPGYCLLLSGDPDADHLTNLPMPERQQFLADM